MVTSLLHYILNINLLLVNINFAFKNVFCNSVFDSGHIFQNTCNKCGRVQYISLEVKIEIDAFYSLPSNCVIKKAIKMNT